MTVDIGGNLKKLRNEIACACEKAGRDSSEITLVAVSKTVGNAEIREAIIAGCTDFGENRVQDFIAKHEIFKGAADFHLIGHLQTNKVKYIVGKAKLIHSVDSIRLLDEIE